MYTSQQFINEIQQYILENGYDPVSVGRFAYNAYFNHSKEINNNLKEKILDIAVMEAGPEFELGEEEFNKIIYSIKNL